VPIELFTVEDSMDFNQIPSFQDGPLILLDSNSEYPITDFDVLIEEGNLTTEKIRPSTDPFNPLDYLLYYDNLSMDVPNPAASNLYT
jgi:hypothetical protein